MADPYLEAAAEAVSNLWYRAGRPARKEQAREIIEAWVGDRELYEVKDISTRDAFVIGGMLAVGAVNGKHQGVLVRVTSANSDTVSSKLAEGEQHE